MKYTLSLLTILLVLSACQQDQEIDENFQLINQSLEGMINSSREIVEEAFNLFKKKVEKGGNSVDGLKAIERAEELIQQSNVLLQEIDTLKTMLRQKARERKKMPRKLADQLDEFIDDLYKEYNDLGFSEDKNSFPLLTRDEFLRKHFQRCSLAAQIAYLSQKQVEIQIYEEEILRELGFADYDASPCCFCGPIAISSSARNTVIQGEEYEADLFLSVLTSRGDLSMYFNAQLIKQTGGIGEVAFPVNRLGMQHWDANIHLKNHETDTTYQLKGKYEVITK